MKRHVPLLVAACVAAAALSAPAAPLQRADVSANPAWILHVDCDALRQTYIGKYLLYQMDKPEMNSNMLAFQSIFTFDLRTQIHGLTGYCDGPASKNGIVILYADVDPDRLIKLVQAADGADAFTNNQQVIYTWIDKAKKPENGDSPRKYAAFQGSRVIMSTGRESMIAALAVIDGAAPNLSASKVWPELGAASDATFVQAAARKLDFLGSDPNMGLLKMSKQARLKASEADEQLNVALTAELGDESTATQMSIVVQGLVALLSLQRDNPAAAKLAGGLSVKRDGSILTVTLAIPSTDLIAALKAYTAEKARLNVATE